MPLSEPHSEFLELCAISTSGQLTEEEQNRLQEHLAVCESCRQALQQYETVVGKAIPAIAASDTTHPDLDSSWSEEQAEKSLFDRLDQQRKGGGKQEKRATDPFNSPHFLPSSSAATWQDVWILYAAGILLFVAISLYAYRLGIHQGVDSATLILPEPSTQTGATLEAELSDAGHEREIARVQIEQRDKIIADLRKQLAQQLVDIDKLKVAKALLEKEVRSGDTAQEELAQQRTDLAQKLEAALSSSQTLQQKLDALARQSAEEAIRSKVLDAKVNDLTRLLSDREVALNEKDELLAHDRDIRELMGARDLYVAEVHDVARDGQTQNTYGRVFYTRGKSLIFYAYDLDEQGGSKRASAFQAWGRRGPDREQALNLGIFYEDNASKKRWILKCDDPKTLAQIDAVFVTVEPNGGSHKPSGKSLLFAYLKVDPNHP